VLNSSVNSEPDSQEAHRQAVYALFVQYSANLRGYILALLPDLSVADDVLQETFVTVARKADTFKLDTNFLAWACAIARFKIKEAMRSEAHRVQALSEEVIDALCASEPPSETDTDERLQLVGQCLDELPQHTRRAFELRYQQAHPAPEVARRLGWTVESAYVLLHRARAMLRECVEGRLKTLVLNEH
jgi:RNA polymerase sigma-70 factor, ECF subfamily